MTNSTTSSSSNLQIMPIKSYETFISTIVGHNISLEPEKKFLRALTVIVRVASKIDGNWVSNPFVTEWNSPNELYFDITETDPEKYDRELFAKLKLAMKDNKNSATHALATQRLGTKAVSDYLSKFKKVIEAEKNRDSKLFIHLKITTALEGLFKDLKFESRVTRVVIKYTYSTFDEPKKKESATEIFPLQIKCNTCDAWQTTASKLMLCISCMLQDQDIYYCNVDCANWDPNHKCTQIKTEAT